MQHCEVGSKVKRATHLHPADLVGLSRLAVDGTVGLTELVEAMHANISGSPTATGITALVYESVRAVTGLVSGGIDSLLTPILPMLDERRSTVEREAALAVLNGVMGDHLAATDNPLAIPMRLRFKGRPYVEAPALPAPSPRDRKTGRAGPRPLHERPAMDPEGA